MVVSLNSRLESNKEEEKGEHGVFGHMGFGHIGSTVLIGVGFGHMGSTVSRGVE